MLKYHFLAVALFYSLVASSQVRHRRNFRIEGVSVKTDVLTLFNGALDEDGDSYSLSGEVYFNDEYSFNIDVGAKKVNHQVLRINRLGGHFRWYFMQDDCSCSAFFLGSYFSSEKVRQPDYTLSYMEAGLTGGFQGLIADHFVIDPSVHLGMKFPHNVYSTEAMSQPSFSEKGLVLRIMLSVGYRF